MFAVRVQNVAGNVIRELLKLTQQPDMINFAGGMPAEDSFPEELLAEISHDVINANPRILQYGATEGYWPLREWIADWVKGIGVTAKPEDVLITSGSQQGIELLAKAMLDPGDKVLMESPTYLAAIQIFRSYEASFAVIHGDDEGVDVDRLDEVLRREKPKLVYLVPTFQNPTGITLSLKRRQQLGKLLASHNAIVIEDDPYGNLRFRGQSVPAIKSFDESGRVVYLGSFSKIISPGLRVGFAIAPAHVLRKMTICKQGMDVHTSNLSQAVVYEFCKRGLLESHIAKITEQYGKKLKVMRECQKMLPSDIRWADPEGGLFLWAEFPQHVNTTELFEKAVREKVAFVPGDSFFVEGGRTNTARFNFSHASEENIREGFVRLARIFEG